MIEVTYNGYPVDNIFSLNENIQSEVLFLKNKYTAILWYFEKEMQECNGRLIIECTQNRLGNIRSEIVYVDVPYELQQKIISRL